MWGRVPTANDMTSAYTSNASGWSQITGRMSQSLWLAPDKPDKHRQMAISKEQP